MISIIIVNYNTGNHLKDCVESIFEFEKDTDFEIIVVDNNSTDNSKEIINSLENKYNSIKSIFLKENNGFAYANNAGSKISQGEYFLILNPDIKFKNKILGEIIKIYNKENIGALGVRLLDKNGRFQYEYYQQMPSIKQYILFYSIFRKFFSKEKTMNKYLYANQVIDNDSVTYNIIIPGAFILISKEIYENIKGFREEYFLFYEDMNLSLDVSKIKPVILLKEFSVQHTGASSMTNENDDIYGKYIISFYKFFKINYGSIKVYTLKFLILLNSIIKIISEFIKVKFKKNNNRILEVHKNILNNLK